MLPTPRAAKITGGDRADFTPSLPGLAMKGLLPTPTTSMETKEDFIQAMFHSSKRPIYSEIDPTGQISRLNPLFVAEMMGFPVNWTVLPFLPGAEKASKPTGTR